MEFPPLQQYVRTLTEKRFEIIKTNVKENSAVFQTLKQFLTWLNVSTKCDVDIIELWERHKADLNLEINRTGEFLYKYVCIDVLAKKL